VGGPVVSICYVVVYVLSEVNLGKWGNILDILGKTLAIRGEMGYTAYVVV